MLERRLLLGAALAAATAGGARAQGTTGPIRIATAGPMTGQYAAFGAQMKAAPNRRSPTSTPPAACSAGSSR